MRRARQRCGREAEIGEGKRSGATRPGAADWLLAEAVRCYETGGSDGAQKDLAALPDAVRGLSGSIDSRLIARANALPCSAALADEIPRLWSVLRGLAVAGVAIAGLAGAATARTAFASPDGTTVNVIWLLASLLVLHVLSFIVWLALMLAAPRRTGGGMLGSAVLWLWRTLSERFAAGPYRLAALRALVARWGGGGAGRWLASTLSHALWTGYLLGALAMALALLSAQQYIFVWETTILDAETYLRLTGALAAAPAALGIAVPDRAAILAAEWPGSPDAGHQLLWSSLLIASLVLYGLLPRGLALLLSILTARRHAAAPPDLGTPYYAQLVTLLSPMVGAVRVVDGEEDVPLPPAAAPDLSALPPSPAAGPVYLIGWELDAPAAGWPPPGTPGHVGDLGRCDGRAELDRAIATLARSDQRPARVVIVLDLRQTPDRGVSAALSALRDAARGQVVVLFSGQGALAGRMPAADAATRVADWVAAGLAAGIAADRMAAVDLDRPAESFGAALGQILGTAP